MNMTNLDHLTPKKLSKILYRLHLIETSLRGVGALFTQGTQNICLEDDEFYGIGAFLQSTSHELQILGDLLQCGYDSTADERNGIEDYDERFKKKSDI